MVSIHEVNQRLVEILGLRGQRVRELTLHAEVGEAPTITITRLIVDAGELRTTTRQFALALAEPEDPCERAMARVREFIEERAATARQRLRDDHVASVRRICGRPPVWEDSNGGRAR